MPDAAATDYPAWKQSYSYEDVDRAQALATELTQQDREAGREAPACGASIKRIREAQRIVRAAKTC